MIELRISGVRQAQALLASAQRTVDAARIAAANRTAVQIKRQMVVEMARPTGVKPKIIRARLRILRASRRRPYAVLRPSGQGIAVSLYRWRPEIRSRSTTRSRIFVAWVDGGWKPAAGFANPRAMDFLPNALSTRVDRRSAGQRARNVGGLNRHGTARVTALAAPVWAVGPSVAAMWRGLGVDGRGERYGRILAAEFEAAFAAQQARQR